VAAFYVTPAYVAASYAEVILAPGEYLVNGLVFTLAPAVTPGYEFVAEPLYTFEAT
jgi:hypothetical protein